MSGTLINVGIAVQVVVDYFCDGMEEEEEEEDEDDDDHDDDDKVVVVVIVIAVIVGGGSGGGAEWWCRRRGFVLACLLNTPLRSSDLPSARPEDSTLLSCGVVL